MKIEKQNKYKELAKLSQEKNVPSGWVYIGQGKDGGLPFGNEQRCSEGSGWSRNADMYGGNSDYHYICKKEVWESATGLVFNNGGLYLETINPVIGAEIQKHLFSLGFEWYGAGQVVSSINMPFIGFSGQTIHAATENTFTGYNYSKITLNELFAMKPAEPELFIPHGLIPEYFVKCTRAGIMTEAKSFTWEVFGLIKKITKPAPKVIDGTHWMDLVNETISAEVQKKLFERGFTWHSPTGPQTVQEGKRFIYLNSHSSHKNCITWDRKFEKEYIEERGMTELSIPELFNEPKEKSVKIAGIEFVSRVEGLRAGCQEVNWEDWDKLIEQISAFQSEITKLYKK